MAARYPSTVFPSTDRVAVEQPLRLEAVEQGDEPYGQVAGLEFGGGLPTVQRSVERSGEYVRRSA